MFVDLITDFMGHKAGTRIDVSDADGAALIETKKARQAPDSALNDIVGKAMASAMEGISGGLQSAVDAALKNFAAAQTLSRKNGNPRIFGATDDGDSKKTFGAFLLAVRAQDRKSLEDMGSSFVEWGSTDRVDKKAAMSTLTGTAGGYTVPTEFYARLMMAVVEKSFVRQMATIIPMGARTVQVPIIDVTTAPAAGDTAFLGGLVARWTEEATTLNETEPNFKQVDLTNYELSGYSKISNSLLADNAIGLEAFLFQIFAKAVNWYEDYAFMRGNGVGKPLGVQTWAGFLQATRSGSNLFAIADYAAMLSKWLPNFDPSCSAWACHPTVLAQLLKMSASGTGSPLVFIQNVRDRPQMMLAGLPLFVTEKLPALGTAGDIMLCDWSQYLIGDRQQLEVAFSEHVAFLNNQTVWRFVNRVGGMPWLKDKVTLQDATSTLSPFVGLAA
jgi:HK97 family phage major capsid protein